ncbi:MAG TPA: aromatic ring-hydroxylating dioxygenase subunit alpha [Phenylobacterium sp.]|nr:aromatic ring-hydroxylating dioxygenase subunit alpha [Phenylobacterium sp.]
MHILDDPSSDTFLLDREVYTSPELFELEMKHIFEGGWVFLGLESQIPEPHDFFTTWIGRHPVIVSRDADGEVHALINTCRHKAAIVCHLRQGNKRAHVCAYHSWSYDSAGRNLVIKNQPVGAYPESFNDREHDLARVARLESYRGILFGSLNPEVPPLVEHLGDARVFLDLVVDQSDEGLELVPGRVSYTFNANWKMQLENCLDGYHVTSTHASYLRVLERRNKEARPDAVKTVFEYKGWEDPAAALGTFTFREGHAMLWASQPISALHPLFERREELEKRVGPARARWMFNTRNLTIFPNVQFADNAALQLRVMRPVAVDKTEMTTYLLAPKGESPAARRQRIRQYEDFFNPSGLATPDDNVSYEDCQTGAGARAVRWSDAYVRGATVRKPGPNDLAKELGISPTYSLTGPFETYDETLLQASFLRWREMLEAAGGPPASAASAGARALEPEEA